jgi:hypothetical protein
VTEFGELEDTDPAQIKSMNLDYQTGDEVDEPRQSGR